MILVGMGFSLERLGLARRILRAGGDSEHHYFLTLFQGMDCGRLFTCTMGVGMRRFTKSDPTMLVPLRTGQR
jgi:hypothetical protein